MNLVSRNSGGTSQFFAIASDFSGATPLLNFWTQTGGSGGSSKMVLSGTGNVGIGTTAPATLFEVSGVAMSRGSTVKSTDGNTCYQVMVDNSGSLNSVKVDCSTLSKLELIKVSGAWTMPDSTYLTSCSAYLASSYYTSQGDGLYWIDTDGVGGNAAFKAWCDMTYDGGGWTLVMRIKNDTTLNYSSTYWTNATLLDEDTGASQKPWLNYNGKFNSWNTVTGTNLRGCRGAPGPNLCLSQSWTGTVTSYSLFNAAYKAGTITRAQVIALFGIEDPAEPNCNASGINYNAGAPTRFGFQGNNEADCNTNDTSWGFGISGYSGTCGAGVVTYNAATGRTYCQQATMWIK